MLSPETIAELRRCVADTPYQYLTAIKPDALAELIDAYENVERYGNALLAAETALERIVGVGGKKPPDTLEQAVAIALEGLNKASAALPE